MQSHDALLILRSSLSAPKLLYLLRTSPCFGHPALAAFDTILRLGLSGITNSDLTDVAWLQASLPVGDGGLGIRSVATLAPSAFLASAAGTWDLQASILHNCLDSIGQFDVFRASAFNFWLGEYSSIDSELADAPVPPTGDNALATAYPVGEEAKRQRSWDAYAVRIDRELVWKANGDRYNRARLLAASAPHSGDWIHTHPISSCGLRLDNEAIRVAVGLRLGLAICEPHPCICGDVCDARGSHSLSCRRSAGRIARHQQLNDLVHRVLTKAGYPSIKEPAGLSTKDKKRPDGLTLVPWKKGRCLTWDVTVGHTMAHLVRSCEAAGGAAEHLAELKTEKYEELAKSYEFCPIALETLGPINESGTLFFKSLGHFLSVTTGDTRETAFLFQRISILIQRFNAICFRGSFGPVGLPESE